MRDVVWQCLVVMLTSQHICQMCVTLWLPGRPLQATLTAQVPRCKAAVTFVTCSTGFRITIEKRCERVEATDECMQNFATGCRGA